MRTAKRILEHNVNNFLLSVYLYCDLYKKGELSNWLFMVGLFGCVKERMKVYHWEWSNF